MSAIHICSLDALTPEHPRTKGSMPKNGEVNTHFALYRTLCCNHELIIREDEVFPDCPRHTNLSTVWKLMKVEAVQTEAMKKDDSTPPSNEVFRRKERA